MIVNASSHPSTPYCETPSLFKSSLKKLPSAKLIPATASEASIESLKKKSLEFSMTVAEPRETKRIRHKNVENVGRALRAIDSINCENQSLYDLNYQNGRGVLSFFNKLCSFKNRITRLDVSHIPISMLELFDLTCDLPRLECFISNSPKLQDCSVVKTNESATPYSISIIEIFQNMSTLRQLDISGCHNISIFAIRDILKNLPQLDSLEISVFHNNLIIISPHLKKLVKLVLHSSLTTDPLMGYIACDLTNLEELKLVQFYDLKNKELIESAPYLKNIRSLNLTFCTKLSWEGFNALFVYANQVTHLNLSHCNFTNLDLIAIAPSLEHILWLDLSYCSHLTDAAMVILAPFLKNIKYLNLLGIPKITSVGEAILIKAIPQTATFLIKTKL